jgi:hypothetical protein
VIRAGFLVVLVPLDVRAFHLARARGGHALRPSMRTSGVLQLAAECGPCPYASPMVYPMWSYFPRNVRPPAWASSFVEVVRSSEGKISTVEHKTGLDSDAVLNHLSSGLVALGYAVESGKTKEAKIHRPVLFGENGTPSVNYEIDAFHDELGIAVEVEAGRGAAGNADYRDIVRTSLILDARYMALLLPVRYRTTSGGKEHAIQAYERTRGQLDAIYASQRLKLPLMGSCSLDTETPGSCFPPGSRGASNRRQPCLDSSLAVQLRDPLLGGSNKVNQGYQLGRLLMSSAAIPFDSGGPPRSARISFIRFDIASEKISVSSD